MITSRTTIYHGLSNGSGALPNPPPGLEGGATGVCVVDAEVHPPKSSSAVTDACRTGLLLEEMGAPHPPEMSLGVMREGTLPSSTLGAAGVAAAGSGAPQGLLSLPEPQGSKADELVPVAIGALTGCGTGLGACAGGGCEDRLNGELNAVLLAIGDITFGADTGAGVGLGGDTGVELANPPKSSAANRSVGIDMGVGFGAAAGCGGGVLWVNEKSSPFKAEGEVTVGFAAGAFEGRLSKKLPPLSGGGEVI